MTGGQILTNMSNLDWVLIPQMTTWKNIIFRGIMLGLVVVIVLFMFIKNKD